MSTPVIADVRLTPAEVAERLRVCEQTIRTALRSGELYGVRVGNRRDKAGRPAGLWRVPLWAVEEWERRFADNSPQEVT